MRRLLPLAALALLLAACGGANRPADLGAAPAKTAVSGSAHFQLTVDATVAGILIHSTENGTLSFRSRRAHVYKLAQNGLPEETIYDGPFRYTNANVQAALQDPTVKPWTKLDVRRLSAADRARQTDDIDHVRALAFLAAGAGTPHRVGGEQVDGAATTHYTAQVDPVRLAARVPAESRGTIRAVIRSDYPTGVFPADFWLDSAGRIRRVRVAYTTPKGSRFSLDATFSEFGVAVDVQPPPPRRVQDISP